VNLPGQSVRGFLEPGPAVVRIGFAGGSQQAVPAVLDFPADDLPGDGRASRRIVRRAKLRPAQHHTRIRDSGHARLQVAEEAEVIDGHSMFPAQVEGGRADGRCPENTERFEMMNGDGNLAPVGGLVTRAFLRGEILGIDGDFHLQGEMIPRNVAAGRGEVEGVLLEVHGS
jgi:hypothetical protein